MKLLSLDKKSMENVLQNVTKKSRHNWGLEFKEENIIIKHDVLNREDYYLIRSTEDTVFVESCPGLNYVGGLIIDKSFKYADFNKWCIEAFKAVAEICYQDFKKRA